MAKSVKYTTYRKQFEDMVKRGAVVIDVLVEKYNTAHGHEDKSNHQNGSYYDSYSGSERMVEYLLYSLPTVSLFEKTTETQYNDRVCKNYV